jgi:ABC-type multidrug transport system fused ATPase/permease subunit
MEAVLKSETAMNVLTSISLAQFLVIAVILIGAVVFFLKFRGKLKKGLEDYRVKTNEEEDMRNKIKNYGQEIQEMKSHHKKDFDSFYKKQQEYRQQSLNKQMDIDNHFDVLTEKIDTLTSLISKQYEETKSIKCNELRKKLLDSYSRYALVENNPKQTWTIMEAETFWSLFSNYETYGGNGFMHTIVKPAMESLKVVSA